MGDPAGIGLELIARCADAPTPFFLIGDPNALARAGGPPNPHIMANAADFKPGAFNVLPEPLAHPETPGAPSAKNAGAVEAAIRRGVEACLARDASGLVTMPIAKATLYEAGFQFPGHTEYVGALTQSAPWPHARGPVMLLAHDHLKVALATIHLPLADVKPALTTQGIVQTARVVAQALQRDYGIANPRLALCGLNPHAGESGKLGREEIDIINPAAAQLRSEGINASDARPADTLFHAEARASYDAAIAMYHDQGLIPVKTLVFWGGVTFTIGLPIVRTSPDHGAGFDIAGSGVARPDSVRAALNMAWAIAQRRSAT